MKPRTYKRRVKQIGSSDVKYITKSFESVVFQKWYKVFSGQEEAKEHRQYLTIGHELEEPIMWKVNFVTRGWYRSCNEEEVCWDVEPRVRVKPDAMDTKNGTITEIKTTKVQNLKDYKEFGPKKDYIQQVQMQLLATGAEYGYLGVYGTYAKERHDVKNYKNLKLDYRRLLIYKVERNENFLNHKVIPKVNYIFDCLDKNIEPTTQGFKESEWYKDYVEDLGKKFGVKQHVKKIY